MSRIVFRDFDEFADAINGIDGRFVPTARAEADWWVQLASVGRLALQQVQTGAPAAFVGDGRQNALTLAMPISAPEHIQIDGCCLAASSIMLVREGQAFAMGVRQAARWVGMTAPIDHPALPPELQQCVIARSGRGKRSAHTRSEAQQVSATRMLVSRLFSPDGGVLTLDGAAAHAAEEEMLISASRALEAGVHRELRPLGRPRLPRERVLSKALEFIEASKGRALLIRDLCNATRVSERSLRNIFQEYFGVGPMRLLKVNQLREIRAALLMADPREQRVWKIAGRFGIWDMSLFAQNYKTLFGETPLQTLRSPAPAPHRDDAMNATWIRYASRKLRGAGAG